MTSIYHMTPTVLDPLSFMVMGLSVKDSSSAIGKFGTGIKYAIAGIVRNGGEIIITCDGTSYYFKGRKREFRGTEFEQILCNGEPLGYTTELGKHWEPWMMFRELHANTLDEGGTTSAEWSSAATVIEVRNFPDYVQAFRHMDFYFLPEDVKVAHKVASYGRLIDNGSGGVYHKGVRVYEIRDMDIDLGGLSIELNDASITEDRTLASPSGQYWYISYILSSYPKLGELLNADGSGEMKIPDLIVDNNYFLTGAVEAFEADPTMKLRENVYLKILPRLQEKSRQFAELSDEEQSVLDKAVDFVTTPWTSVPPGWSVGAADLPPNVHGLCSPDRQRIYVTRALLGGEHNKTLCETLIEEIIHAKYNANDYSRKFQNVSLEIIGNLLLTMKSSPFLQSFARPKSNMELIAEILRGGAGGGGAVTSAPIKDEDIPF